MKARDGVNSDIFVFKNGEHWRVYALSRGAIKQVCKIESRFGKL